MANPETTKALCDRIAARQRELGGRKPISEAAVIRKAQQQMKGIKADAIRRIRRGHPPSRETLRAIAYGLDCDLAYLEEVAPDIRLDSRPDDPKRSRYTGVYDSVSPSKQDEFIAAVEAVARLVASEADVPGEGEPSPIPVAPRRRAGGRKGGAS